MDQVIREFEGGIKVKMDFIDPDWIVETYLPEWAELRFAGKYDPNTGILFIKRFRRHLHEILNAFGISAWVIQTLEEFETNKLKLIVMDLPDSSERFEITLEKLKLEGTWKNWKQQGFDRQCFCPIRFWTKKR